MAERSAIACCASPPAAARGRMAAISTPLSSLIGIPLRQIAANELSAATVQAGSLWAAKPTVVVVLRRPG